MKLKIGTRYFSAQTLGFYLYDGEREDIPADAVVVTDDEFAQAMSAPSQGMQVGTIDGRPVVVEAPPLTPDQLAEAARIHRDSLLRESDWTQLPDVEKETRLRWVPYRQALRDIPQQEGFPAGIEWPPQPGDGNAIDDSTAA